MWASPVANHFILDESIRVDTSSREPPSLLLKNSRDANSHENLGNSNRDNGIREATPEENL